MKSLIAGVLKAIPGMLVGVVLWSVVATVALVVYYLGYELGYLGLLCSKGKFGLGLCTPPPAATQQALREGVFYLTLFAFTWGEVLAGLVGAVCGGALGAATMRVFSALRSAGRRPRGSNPSENPGC